MNNKKTYIDFNEALNNSMLLHPVDPLYVLNNQYQSGVDMFKARDNLIFYMHTGRSTEFIETFGRLNEQRRFWRRGVLNNLRQIEWVSKSMESTFISNELPLFDPRYTAPDDIMKQFFEGLQADIDLIAEVIDYGSTFQATKQEVVNMPRVSYSKREGLEVDGIKVALGTKEQTICNIIFTNKKLLNKNWLYDELLDEKAEQLRGNDIVKVRQIQTAKTRINKRIAENTPNNIKDVFIGHGSIQLNPKYCR